MCEITDDIPKPMVEVGGRPMLWHVLRALAGAGVQDAAVIVGYMADSIRNYFGTGENVGLKLSYFTQEIQDGTGRAAEPAREYLSGGPFFFTFGDILTKAKAYVEMAGVFDQSPTDLLLAVRRVDDPYRGGAVYTDGDRVTEIVEKPPKGSSRTDLISAGIFIASPVFFDYTSRLELSERGEYELPDAIRMMIESGLDVRAFELVSYWRDVGTPEDLIGAGRDALELDGLVEEE
jgi:NDP-sugar pyrophosphorylase family protein